MTHKSNLRTRKPSWPKILSRSLPSGNTQWRIDVLVDGHRIYESFKTEAEAISRAWQIDGDRKKAGKAGFELPMSKRVEASKCNELLATHNATITEAVEHYLKHVLAFRNAPTVAEIVEKMINEASANGRREKTVADLRSRLGHFAETFGTRQVSAITLEELKAFFDETSVAARTTISRATKVSQLFNYAIRNGWTNENLVERISRPSVEDKAVDFYTPIEAKVLLHHAAGAGVLPFVAIGMFAGLRTNEIMRLDWSAVKLAEHSLIVGSEVAKKRSRRVVEINDALAAWLGLCARPAGRVCDFREDQLMFHIRQLVKAAGVTWKKNGLRHSFATYHLALHGDPVKTAFQCGNSPVVIHNHYKGLAGKNEVAKFWALRPAADADGKIVPMQQTVNA